MAEASDLRIWRLPMVCLDDRRLIAQHAEAHICISVLTKDATGEKTGWINTPQAQQWKGKRSALVEYHDEMVVPEMEYRGFNHKSPLPLSFSYRLPEHEQGHEFWDNVTWEQVLLDCRHLIEKHARDRELVMSSAKLGRKTRVVTPVGHNAAAIVSVFHRAIAHVYGFDAADSETLQLKALKLTREKLLEDPPKRKAKAA